MREPMCEPTAQSRFPFALPLLIALSAGLGALSPSFPADPLPPAFNQEIAPPKLPDRPANEKRDPPDDLNNTTASV